MASYIPTRDDAGGINGVQPREEGQPLFASVLADSMRSVGAADEEAQPMPPAKPRLERDVILLVSGALAGVLLFALFVGGASPAPAAPRPIQAAPTATATVTPTPTATPAPTPTATAIPPTEEIAPAVVEPTVCSLDNAPFIVRQQVFPLGSVVGASCVSAEDAQANAAALADALIATATAEAGR
jgi:hypothetical protein